MWKTSREDLRPAGRLEHMLKLAVALVIIVGVLVVRPSGLFGRAHVTRV